MLLPRPARLLRQCPRLPGRPLPLPRLASTATVVRPNPTAPGIDPSFGPLLREVDLTIRKQHRGSVPPVEHANAYASSSSPEGNHGPSPQHGELELQMPEEPDYAEAREERRSPAAVLGSKRLGLVVLPDQLAEAVQNEINGGFLTPPPLPTTLCPRHPLSSATVVA